MTYREIMPALRVKRTGNYRVFEHEGTAKDAIADMTEHLKSIGVNV